MDDLSNRVLEFDGFKVDLHERSVSYREQIVPLTPKAFDTLALLVLHRGRVVEKETFLSEIWPDTFVEEATLAQNVSTLRKALQINERGSQYIETVARRGYKFVADVRETFFDEETLIVERNSSIHIIAEREFVGSSGNEKKTTQVERAAARSRNFRRTVIVIGIVACGLVVLTAAVMWNIRFSQPGFAWSKFNNAKTTRLTFSGNLRRAVLSPDGKYVALVEGQKGMQSLQVRQVDNSNFVEIAKKDDPGFLGATFSNDGQSIYYVSMSREGDTSFLKGVLFKTSILGGTPQQVIEDIDSGAAISLDGQKIAFLRLSPKEQESAIVVADVNGKNERRIAVRKWSERFLPDGLAWSPDGKTIACPAMTTGDAGVFTQLVAVDAETGGQKTLVDGGDNWLWFGQMAWLNDNSGVIFITAKSESDVLADEIWAASYPDGKMHFITGGVNGFSGFSMNTRSDLIAAVESTVTSSFVMVPTAEGGNEQKFGEGLSEISMVPLGMAITKDNRIVYASRQNGNVDLWIMNMDGLGRRQITFDTKADYLPVISSDERFIFFVSNRSGSNGVWRMNFDGSDVKQIIKLPRLSPLNISADDRWVYYTAASPDQASVLWKVPIDGGEPIQVSPRLTFLPVVSPDGKFIACYKYVRTATDPVQFKLKMTILSADDGSVLHQFGNFTESGAPPLVWTPDSQSLTYVITRSGISNVWQQPIENGPEKQLTNFMSDEVFRFGWTHDGKSLICDRGMIINDVMLLRDLSSGL